MKRPDLLKRAAAADRAGVSVSTLRRWQARGWLSAEFVGPDGTHHYAPEVIDSAKERARTRMGNDGVLTGPAWARIYELADSGKTERQIVRELELSPDTVARALTRYRKSERAWLVSAEVRRRIVAAIGPVESPAELADELERLAPQLDRARLSSMRRYVPSNGC